MTFLSGRVLPHLATRRLQITVILDLKVEFVEVFNHLCLGLAELVGQIRHVVAHQVKLASHAQELNSIYCEKQRSQVLAKFLGGFLPPSRSPRA